MDVSIFVLNMQSCNSENLALFNTFDDAGG